MHPTHALLLDALLDAGVLLSLHEACKQLFFSLNAAKEDSP